MYGIINDDYHSDETVQQYLQTDGIVRIEKIENGLYMDGPGTEDALYSGVQKGDGESFISAEEQQNQTVEAIYKMITEHK